MAPSGTPRSERICALDAVKQLSAPFLSTSSLQIHPFAGQAAQEGLAASLTLNSAVQTLARPWT